MTISAPAAVSASIASSQQSFALSAIRSNAQAQQAIANVVEQAAQSISTSATRGNNVNISA